jgi:hypothetical protein
MSRTQSRRQRVKPSKNLALIENLRRLLNLQTVQWHRIHLRAADLSLNYIPTKVALLGGIAAKSAFCDDLDTIFAKNLGESKTWERLASGTGS